jgi:hypothetical protein
MPRHDKCLSSDDKADNTTDDNTDCLSDDSGNKTDITTDYDIDSLLENSDDDTNNKASLGEELHPPEYYLNRAANCNSYSS